MYTIHKYELKPSLTGYCTAEMPKGAEILTAQLQKEKYIIWATINDKLKKEERAFWMLGTGWDLNNPFPKDLKYISTIQEGIYVWHVFEEI